MLKTKVIIITLEYPPLRGGAGVYSEELAYATVQSGIDLEIWSPIGSVQNHGIQLKPLPFCGSQSLVSSFKLILEIKKRLNQLSQPFILHVAEPGSLRAFVRFAWMLPKNIDFYVTIHGSELVRFTRFFLEAKWFRKFLARAKKIHVLSSYNQRELLSFCPESKTIICKFPGAPARRILPTSKRTESINPKVRILCVARIHPRKGQDYLLDIVGLLNQELQRKIDICFVGPVKNARFYQKLLNQEKDLICDVQFLGDLNDELLRIEYEKADIFALTSMPLLNSVEGFGFVYMEASAHGLPILANRVGGVEEAIQDGITGILVDPNNEKKIRSELERLINDSDERKRMGENGRFWASQHTWKKVAVNLFDKLLTRHPQRQDVID